MNGVFPDEIRPSSQCRIDRLHCDERRFCACQLGGVRRPDELSVSSLSDTFPQSAWIEA